VTKKAAAVSEALELFAPLDVALVGSIMLVHVLAVAKSVRGLYQR
jgi:hypothetical protein